jgi:hypothetical protein
MNKNETLRLRISAVGSYPTNGTIMNVYEVSGDEEALKAYCEWLETSKIKPENRYSDAGIPKYFSSDFGSEIVFGRKSQKWNISNLEQSAIAQQTRRMVALGNTIVANELAKMQAHEILASIKKTLRASGNSTSTAPTPSAKVEQTEEESLDMP